MGLSGTHARAPTNQAAGRDVRHLPFVLCSRQFGRASAPTIPRRVHTMRGPKARTSTRFSAISSCVWQAIRILRPGFALSSASIRRRMTSRRDGNRHASISVVPQIVLCEARWEGERLKETVPARGRRARRRGTVVERVFRHPNAERFLRKVREFDECEEIVDSVDDKPIGREDLFRLNRPAMEFSCHPSDDPCYFLRNLLPGH